MHGDLGFLIAINMKYTHLLQVTPNPDTGTVYIRISQCISWMAVRCNKLKDESSALSPVI